MSYREKENEYPETRPQSVHHLSLTAAPSGQGSRGPSYLPETALRKKAPLLPPLSNGGSAALLGLTLPVLSSSECADCPSLGLHPGPFSVSLLEANDTYGHS